MKELNKTEIKAISGGLSAGQAFALTKIATKPFAKLAVNGLFTLAKTSPGSMTKYIVVPLIQVGITFGCFEAYNYITAQKSSAET